MPDSKMQNLLLVVAKALKSPLSLGLLGAGLLFALLMHNLLGLLILGGAAAGVVAFIIARLQDESFIRSAIQDANERDRRADRQERELRIEELDVDSRVRMKTIVRLQNEIAEDIERSSVNELAAGMTDTVEVTDGLVDRALTMAQKRRDLQHYLAKTDKKSIENSIYSLKTKVQQTTDPIKQTEIESLLTAKQQELDDYNAIENSASSVLDQLDSIEYAFASLRAKLVRLNSSEIREWTSANEDLKTELGGLNQSVDVLVQSINEALSIGRSE